MKTGGGGRLPKVPSDRDQPKTVTKSRVNQSRKKTWTKSDRKESEEQLEKENLRASADRQCKVPTEVFKRKPPP